MADEIVIAFSFDKGYAEQATVMVYSLLESNPNSKFKLFAFVHDLDNGVQKKILANFSGFPNFELHWKIFDEKLINSFEHREGHVNEYTYTKIYVAQLLKDYKRILYFDCDMLILGDVSPLAGISLHGKTAGVVYDPSIRHHEVGKMVGKSYFNAGMLVIDTVPWIQNNYTEKTVQTLTALGERAIERDQDALNLTLASDTYFLEAKWNFQSHHVAEAQEAGIRKIETKFSPAIVHFTGNLKPWNFKSSSPFKKKYYFYLKKTNFARSHKPLNKTFGNVARRMARNVLVSLHILKY